MTGRYDDSLFPPEQSAAPEAIAPPEPTAAPEAIAAPVTTSIPVGPIAGAITGGLVLVLVGILFLNWKNRQRAAKSMQAGGSITPMTPGGADNPGELIASGDRSTQSNQTLSTASPSFGHLGEKAQLHRQALEAAVVSGGLYELSLHGRAQFRATRKSQIAPTASGSTASTHAHPTPHNHMTTLAEISRATLPQIDTDPILITSVPILSTSTADQIQDVQASIDAILRCMDPETGERGQLQHVQEAGDTSAEERLRLVREQLRQLQGRLDEDGVEGAIEDLPGYESPKDGQGFALPLSLPTALS